MNRIVTSAALAASALLALPVASEAATTFGSRLVNEPANSGECASLLTPCSLVSYIHPSDPNGDPYSGGAPVDGVITRFRIRAVGEGNTPATVTFRLARVSLPNPQNNDVALGTAAGTGPTVTIPPGNGPDVPVREFPGSLPVKKGDHLAIDGTNVLATYNSSGDKFSYRFDPPLVDGQGPRASNEATGELLVQADIEPDADGDGLGDQSQDPAVEKARSADTTKPRLSKLRLTRKALSYRLSESAKVTVRIKQGRRTLKRLSATGVAGRNRLAINRRTLPRGRYSVVVSAKDAAGNSSGAKRIALRVKR